MRTNCFLIRKHRSRARVEQHHLQPGRPHQRPGEGQRTRGHQVGQAQEGIRVCVHLLFQQSKW